MDNGTGMTYWDKRRIKELWKEGYAAIELGIMYNVKPESIYYITRGIKRPERI